MLPQEQKDKESSASSSASASARKDNAAFQKLLQNTEILLMEAKENFRSGDLDAAIDKFIQLLELNQNSFRRIYSTLALVCLEIATCFQGKPKFEEEAIAFCKHGIEYCDVGKALLPEGYPEDKMPAVYLNMYKKEMELKADKLLEKLPYKKAIFWRNCGYLVARLSKPSIGKALLYEKIYKNCNSKGSL